jgi:hypothetical protein
MTDEQYGIVASRRQAYDQLLWQTPVLSLTAQAFLLTIALGPDSSPAARFMSAALSLITALASIQLMAKHRYYEVVASHLLQKFEDEKKADGFEAVHARRPFPNENVSFLVRWSSFVVWTITLSAFAVVALIVLLWPGLLS